MKETLCGQGCELCTRADSSKLRTHQYGCATVGRLVALPAPETRMGKLFPSLFRLLHMARGTSAVSGAGERTRLMQGLLLLTLLWLQPSALPPPAVDTNVSPENRWDVAQLVPALLRGIPQVSTPTPGASGDTRVDVCLCTALGRDGCTRSAFPCERPVSRC